MKIRDRVRELRRVRAGDLRPSPRNWRTHPQAQREALQGVLADVGFADALLCRELDDGTLELIDGHLRAETTPDSEVPVLVLDVDEEEANKLLLTIDPLAGLAGVDDEQLAELLGGVRFDNRAVQAVLDDLAESSGLAMAENDVVEDEAPEPLAEAVTAPGDLWVLGRHRLLCGDATKSEDVLRLLDGDKAALVATDPPYLVEYTGQRVNDSGKDWSGTYHEIDIVDADAFFRDVFTNVLAVLAPHAAIYCWHAHKRQRLIAGIWEELGILDHQQIIWVKPSPVFGSVFWHFRHEPCMMGWLQGSKPEHDGSHEFDSVWEVGWEGGKRRIVGNEHPTQKPVELFARPMRKHTRRGDIVYEPFSGSGSQLVAAEQLERRCCAMEIEPVFVDVAIRRWQALTGKEAVREDGVTWNELARGKEVA